MEDKARAIEILRGIWYDSGDTCITKARMIGFDYDGRHAKISQLLAYIRDEELRDTIIQLYTTREMYEYMAQEAGKLL